MKIASIWLSQVSEQENLQEIPWKKKKNTKLDKAKLGFQSDVKIVFSESLMPYNQHLAWMCRELKQARIHSCWSSKGVP